MRAIRLYWRTARVAPFLRQNGYSGYASQIIGISMIPTAHSNVSKRRDRPAQKKKNRSRTKIRKRVCSEKISQNLSRKPSLPCQLRNTASVNGEALPGP